MAGMAASLAISRADSCLEAKLDADISLPLLGVTADGGRETAQEGIAEYRARTRGPRRRPAQFRAQRQRGRKKILHTAAEVIRETVVE